MTDRKCVACGKIIDRKNLIKITKEHSTSNIVINGNCKVFGRSVYLCYNTECIENIFKKNKLQKFLKAPVDAELKGKLINELRHD